MVELTRTIRFSLAGDGSLLQDMPKANTFAGWPPMPGLGRYYEIELTCLGQPDPQTGYFINIKKMDQAVREHALPLMSAAIKEDAADGSTVPLGSLLRQMIQAIDPELPGEIAQLTLRLTPYLSITMEARTMSTVTIAHRYEFAAAHRLHVPEFDDKHNAEIFGKCNNPAGHGHNYQFEIALSWPIDDQGHAAPTDALDELIDQAVVDRLDHKHLNSDVPQFAELNPSVEHIAQVIFDWADKALAESSVLNEGKLQAVTVWETGKTACTYRGSHARAAK
jgi:6-pyruvoyltetrahydropterin/6-carboxytetrahydropterin synthase